MKTYNEMFENCWHALNRACQLFSFCDVRILARGLLRETATEKS